MNLKKLGNIFNLALILFIASPCLVFGADPFDNFYKKIAIIEEWVKLIGASGGLLSTIWVGILIFVYEKDYLDSSVLWTAGIGVACLLAIPLFSFLVWLLPALLVILIAWLFNNSK